MKKIYYLITLLAILSACNKDEFHSRRLYVGEGRWKIESLQYQTYDSTGVVVHDSTVTGLGELVFFKSGSMSALYDYRLGAWINSDTSGTHWYSIEYVFDGERVDVRGIDGKLLINGTYTSVENKKRKQVWVTTTVHQTLASLPSLGSKTTMTLKKE